MRSCCTCHFLFVYRWFRYLSPDPNNLTLYWWFTRQQSLYQVAADKSRSPSHENPLPVQFHIIFQHILKQLINNQKSAINNQLFHSPSACGQQFVHFPDSVYNLFLLYIAISHLSISSCFFKCNNVSSSVSEKRGTPKFIVFDPLSE